MYRIFLATGIIISFFWTTQAQENPCSEPNSKVIFHRFYKNKAFEDERIEEIEFTVKEITHQYVTNFEKTKEYLWINIILNEEAIDEFYLEVRLRIPKETLTIGEKIVLPVKNKDRVQVSLFFPDTFAQSSEYIDNEEDVTGKIELNWMGDGQFCGSVEFMVFHEQYAKEGTIKAKLRPDGHKKYSKGKIDNFSSLNQ